MPGSFARRLREATWDDHEDAAEASYLHELTAGRLELDSYVLLVAQHHAIYTALEAAAPAMARDPLVGQFVRDELTRLPALEQDLAALLGPDWRSGLRTASSTADYVTRLEQVVAEGSATRYLAHHYVRYLGDLSGGLMIGPAVRRCYGLSGHAGTRFYVFEEIPDPAAFKDEYRRRLDQLPLSEPQRAEVLAEARHAYRLNRAVLADLDELAAA